MIRLSRINEDFSNELTKRVYKNIILRCKDTECQETQLFVLLPNENNFCIRIKQTVIVFISCIIFEKLPDPQNIAQ